MKGLLSLFDMYGLSSFTLFDRSLSRFEVLGPLTRPISQLTNIFRLFDKKKYSNDISIVFTETPLTINDYVRPAALPKSPKFRIGNARTIVSGKI